MEICGFGWENALLAADLSASAALSALPVTNLQTQQGAASLAWRVPDTKATLTATLPSATSWRVLSLHRTNLTAQASWTATVRNADEVVTSVSGMCGVLGGQCVMVLPQPVRGTSLTVALSDPDNPDGFLSIPLAFAGPLWQPTRNYASDSTETRTVGEQVTTTLSGAEFVEPRYFQRSMTIAHQSYGDADAAVLRQILRQAATGQNMLFLPDPSLAPPALAQTALFGRLSGGELSNPFGPADRHALSLTLTERL